MASNKDILNLNVGMVVVSLIPFLTDQNLFIPFACKMTTLPNNTNQETLT